jgi:hypothetical protein
MTIAGRELAADSAAPAPMQQSTGIRLCLRALCQRDLEANNSFSYETNGMLWPSVAQFVCLIHLPESEGC